MNRIPLAGIFSASLLFVGLSGSASASTSKVVPIGDNTYSITREASSAFKRDVDALQAEAEADAAKYCADHGKQLKIIAVSADRPFFSLGYASAKVVFKALDAGSPELTSSASAAAAASASAPVALPADPLTQPSVPGDLYTELIKLDDLRKRGILTDKEFNAEKKKLLKRSR